MLLFWEIIKILLFLINCVKKIRRPVMVTLEKIDQVVERTGVTYEEARALY